jgi:adenosylcobinamide kinase / adenosylcobinamide-phosphate guanylyltransferase
VLASATRCNREVRCDTGAAPATVSGETAAKTTGLAKPGREGAAGDDPEPGDLCIAQVRDDPRVEEGPLPSADADRACTALSPVTLILGGARSGKSRYAESLIERAAAGGTYCATAEAGDAEMAERIAMHRARRGRFWSTVEEPLALAPAIAVEATPTRPLLVDCLTLWTSNLLLAGKSIGDESQALCTALRRASGPVVLVANEVGLGLVPETALGRRFRDAAGQLNQMVAALADRVVFVAAGLPLTLKDG